VLLLDYKTGRPAQKDLNCPRPKEPQLLVYAAASESKVAGVYFAKVKARELKLIGYGPHEKRGSQWDGARSAEAREEVEGLARDFLAGRAAVHPRNGACSWCEVKPLCRVSEQAGESAEECE
jgi:RecB family exonuclease